MTARGTDTNREEYLDALDRALRPLASDAEREALLGQTGEALQEAFSDLGRPETAAEIVEAFGSPEELAVALARESAAAGDVRATGAPDDAAGRVLGMPYEVRVPTAERLASRMFNPADPRLFVPRAFGMGWDLNFGALAVRLGWMRPDDVQDVPFSGVPRALTASMSLASLAALAVALGWAALVAEDLPRRIPYHFGLTGPDRFAAPLPAAGQVLGIPLAIVIVIVIATFVRPSTPIGRGLAAAATPAIALIGVGMWANAVAWATRGSYLVPSAVVVVVPLAVMFGLLLLLTRVGLRAEWREHGVAKK